MYLGVMQARVSSDDLKELMPLLKYINLLLEAVSRIVAFPLLNVIFIIE